MKRFNYIKKIKTMKYTKLVLGIIIGVLISSYPIYYAAILWASDLTAYDNSESGLTSTTVQAAIDELNGKIPTDGCPMDAICHWPKSWSEVAVGDYVQMTPNPGTLDSSNRYATDTTKTGASSVEYIYPKELHLWRVIKVNTDGTIEMVSEYISSTRVTFQGITGYANFVGYLNTLANQYQNPAYTISARHIGYHGQTEFITDRSAFDGTFGTIITSSTPNSFNTMSSYESQGGGDTMYFYDIQVNSGLVQLAYGNKGDQSMKAKICNDSNCSNPSSDAATYFLASREYTYYTNPSYKFATRLIMTSSGQTSRAHIRYYEYGNWENSYRVSSLRPIVTLKSGLSPANAFGDIEDPFILE